MDLAQLQKELADRKLYTGEIDGKFGRLTAAAIDQFVLGAIGLLDPEWTDDRRRLAAEQAIYASLHIDVGRIDGLMGEQTRHAQRVYTALLNGKSASETQWRDRVDAEAAKAPVNLTAVPIHRAKWPRQGEVHRFFGAPGSNQTMLELPFPMRLDWQPSAFVHRVSCHARVADALSRIWSKTLAHYGDEAIARFRLDRFGGCLNIRKMRGSHAMSMHSWGIAWDVDPSRNQLQWGRDRALLDAPEYDAFWGFVEAEGATSLGRARNYDWMHFQFANLA